MQVTVLHHADAGEGEWPAERVKAHLAAAGLHGRYCAAQDAAAEAIIRSASGVVLVVGGDWTVATAAALLDRTQAQLAILPTGGSNNIARSLGIHADPARIAWGLRNATSISLHIGELRTPGETCCFVEGVGIGALARSMQTPMKGLPRSRKQIVGRDALRRALLDGAPCRATVTLDGAAVEEPALIFEFLNIARAGPGLQLASPRDADGRLTAVWLPMTARDAMLDWLERPDASQPPLREARTRRVGLRLNGEPLRVDDAVRPEADVPVALALQDQPIRILVPEVTA